jgi:CheY-like chemotaxis protein
VVADGACRLRPEAGHDRPGGPTTDPDDTGLDVLVVEDDADTADSMALLLRLSGHRARVARDGPSALREAQASPPDVVLLDIALPGLDGWRLAERLRALAPEKGPFLIAVSGHGRPADRRRSREAGIHLHLLKPAAPDFLLNVLRRVQAFLTPRGLAPGRQPTEGGGPRRCPALS